MAGWFLKILGSLTGNVAEVDANNQLLVRGAVDPNKAGHYGLAAVIDDGSFTGTPRGKRGWITEAGRLLVAPTILLWDDTFNAGSQNTAKYKHAASTMTTTQAGGAMTMNSAASVAAAANCGLQSWRTFPLFGSHETRVVITGYEVSGFPHVANNVAEFGLFSVALPAITLPTDGAFFRYNAAGELRGVISFNGTETQTAAMTKPSAGVAHDFMIICQNDVVTFWIDRQLRGTIALLTDAPALGQPFMSATQPVTFRQYIPGAVPASATKFNFTDVYVTIVGPDLVKPWPDVKAGMGHVAYQGQNGGTMGTTAQYANSANPAAAVPTNTTAALGSGLGGQFWETHSLALGTDGIICSFQNPAGSAAQTPRTLFIYGVTIDSTIQTVLAGGPYGISWSLAFGHTAVSLATAEGASFSAALTTKASRRIALGKMAVTAAQAVATRVAGSPIKVTFTVPIPVAPGEFVAVVAKHETGGTVGTTGVIAHNITFDAMFE